VDAIRKIRPERLISEFWTKTESPIEYGGLAGIGAFGGMRRGATDHELDLMFKRIRRDYWDSTVRFATLTCRRNS
jgi:hypothetical protein